MKCSSANILKTFCFSLVLAVSACSGQNDRFAGDRYRVLWPNSDGDLTLQTIKIDTLDNPQGLEGRNARILIQPGDNGGQLVAEKPVGRYVRASDGSMIPADYMTLQAVTAYAHQERLRAFDEKAGVNTLNWPLTVALQVKVLDRGSVVENNAIYDGRLDAMLVVPYTLPDLPVAFNPGIVAHEHFHFIFQHSILNRLKIKQTTGCTHHHGIVSYDPTSDSSPGEEEGISKQTTIDTEEDPVTPQIYNAFILRAMNEGLADFWGWAYSNDISFVSRSLPAVDRARRLDVDPERLPTEEALRASLYDRRRADRVVNDDVKMARAYKLGTQYARYLKSLVGTLVAENQMAPEEAKMLVAKSVVASLQTVSAESVRAYNSGFFSPNVLLKPLILSLPSVNRSACAALEGFRAFEKNYEQPKACAEVVQ